MLHYHHSFAPILAPARVWLCQPERCGGKGVGGRGKTGVFPPQEILMPKISKRLKEAHSLVEAGKAYSIEEAIELAKKTAMTKFKGSVEVHINLSIDAKQSDQSVRGQITLPHSTGKSVRVIAFVTAGKEDEAKKAGADVVGGEELIKEIQGSQKTDFDTAVAEPAMMPKLAPVAKILGPRGLMPSPRTGTVTADIAKAIKEIKAGRLDFKNDDTGNVHATLGKSDLGNSELAENFKVFYQAVVRAKPAAVKKQYVSTVTINSTMGPGIKVQV